MIHKNLLNEKQVFDIGMSNDNYHEISKFVEVIGKKNLLKVLLLIYYENKINFNKIKKKAELTSSTLSPILHELLRLELAEKIKIEKDSTHQEYGITNFGLKIISKIREISFLMSMNSRELKKMEVSEALKELMLEIGWAETQKFIFHLKNKYSLELLNTDKPKEICEILSDFYKDSCDRLIKEFHDKINDVKLNE